MDTTTITPELERQAQRIASLIATAISAALDHRPIVAPGALDEKAAAAYLHKSRQWLEGRRAKDAQAIAEGRAPLGPPARYDASGSVFYLRVELDRWLGELARERPKRKAEAAP
jgi:hypothetical protein